MGQVFQREGITLGAVRSSAWCRCTDTAQLAFGRAEVWPALNSFFQGQGDDAAQTRAVLQALATLRAPANWMLVTHQVNITALTGEVARPGEGIVLRRKGATMVVAGILLFYVVLGAVMDELSMILLTIPIFFPMIMGLDFGMPKESVAIWFGIMVLMTVGFGLLAPPVGLNVYIVNGMAPGVPIAESYRGVLPFLASDVLRTTLLLTFPSITLWLVLTVYLLESRLYPQLKARRALGWLGMGVVLLAVVFPGATYPSLSSPWMPLHWALGIASYGLIAAAVGHAWLMQRAERAMRQGRTADTDITIFDSTGLAVQDLA